MYLALFCLVIILTLDGFTLSMLSIFQPIGLQFDSYVVVADKNLPFPFHSVFHVSKRNETRIVSETVIKSLLKKHFQFI